MLFLNGEIWSTKSDFGKSYPVSLGTLCRIIFMKHILQIFQNCQKHWISIFHSNMMFTKCSSNSTYFKHRTDNERFHILAVELKHQFLLSNITTSKLRTLFNPVLEMNHLYTCWDLNKSCIECNKIQPLVGCKYFVWNEKNCILKRLFQPNGTHLWADKCW